MGQTPAIAHARAERRKRQVREWKEREAKDARQKRSDRRRRKGEGHEGVGVTSTEDAGHLGGRKVRFLEG